MSRRLAVAIVGLLVAGTLTGLAADPAWADAPRVAGIGSGFAALEIDQWRADTARHAVLAQGQLRRAGLDASDASSSQSGTARLRGVGHHVSRRAEVPTLAGAHAAAATRSQDCFVYVPVSAGGLALMYNLVDDVRGNG